MTGRHFAAALVATACLALTACGAAGSNAEGNAVTGSAAPGSSVPGSSVPGPSVSGPSVPGSAASGAPKPTPPVVTKPGVPNTATPFPGEMTVRGTVAAGVEINCMVLKADNGAAYLLLGGDENLIQAGKRLEVVGRPQPGLVSYCGEGIPFKVTRVRAI